jgi:iron complex transport system substrate-binding protein
MKRTVALLLALVTLLPACGGDDDSGDGGVEAEASGGETTNGADTTSAPAGGHSSGEVGGPITVEHSYGTTVVEGVPERIVSLDGQWTDVLVALDAPLVGAATDPTVDGGRYPWQDGIPEDVESIEVTDAIPVEAVAALQPDLIVVTWAVTEQATYDLLSQVAPTIPMLGDAPVDRWQDIAAVAGDVLGRPDEGAALVDEVDRLIAEVTAELPGLEGRTYAMANYVPGDKIYVVADPDDGASTFFRQMGIEIDPELVDMAESGSRDRLELSLEQVGLLDSDLLVLLTNGVDPAEIPGYESLPAVRSGAVAVLDLAEVVGLNTPSPLSIPYSLDAVRPALEALAAA